MEIHVLTKLYSGQHFLEHQRILLITSRYLNNGLYFSADLLLQCLDSGY